MKKIWVLATSVAMLSSGCASIVNGHNQSLSIETRSKGEKIVDASCKLGNDKGTWYVKTPGSTTVRRSYENLSVSCEKPGLEPGLTSAKSSTKAMAFGNIIFGGAIGAGVDVMSGAAYDYPEVIVVDMAESPVSVPAAVSIVPAPTGTMTSTLGEIKTSN
ncbi:MAG: hypothetical protein ABL877_03875 [Thiobacillus sp.]